MNYNPDSQRLYFDDLINARDLGGMPLSDNRVFKEKVLLRCGSPSLASVKAFEELKEFGVRTVIDLRSEAEVSHYGNPFEKDADTSFYNVSLFLGDPDSDDDPTMMFLRSHSLGDFYVLMLEELAPRIIEVLRIIKNSEKTVLFHCAHGKDRTGVIAAILYLIAGAERENIITNYKVSYEYAKHFLDPLIEVREPLMKHTLRSDASNMVTLLDYIDNEYSGDIKQYLNKYGMNNNEIEELKEMISVKL